MGNTGYVKQKRAKEMFFRNMSVLWMLNHYPNNF